MAQVIVRNLDDKVVGALKAKAELHEHPLEQELREILVQASRLTAQEKLRLVDSIREMSPKAVSTDSTRLVREDRDRR